MGKWFGLWCIMGLPALVLAQAGPGLQLVVNPDLERAANADDWPDGYDGRTPAAAWLAEEGNHFVRLGTVGGTTPQTASIGQSLKLQPEWFKLRLSVRIRTHDVGQGAESWHNARVAMAFFDAGGQQVGGWPTVLYWTGTTGGWVTETRDYRIPAGATSLRITPALFSATGAVDYDDFTVTVIANQPRLEDLLLPEGIVANWSNDGPVREATATRERLCLNGLWRFLPQMPDAPGDPATLPAAGQGWGWLKVPAAWPGRGNESTRPFAPDIWELSVEWAQVAAGWYERQVTVPAAWAGRRVGLAIDLPQTAARVLLDGEPAGEIRWPGGTLDLTGRLPAGATVTLSVQVTCDPMATDKLVTMREDLVEKMKADVRFRGLCGDVWLISEPTGARLTRLLCEPSVRRGQLGLAVGLEGVRPGVAYRLEAAATLRGEAVWQGRSEPFTPTAAATTAEVSLAWADAARWDFEQPNLHDLTVSLIEESTGQTVDQRRERFGFREVWVDGRDLILNGRPVHLRAVNFSGVTRHEGDLTPFALQSTFARLRAMGFNFVIWSNYGLSPGETGAFEQVLRAADEAGFAMSVSLPHAVRQYDGTKGELGPLWRTTADYMVGVTGNHPSALTYAINHNSLGYYGDQNPAKIDGRFTQQPAGNEGFYANRAIAAASEAYVRALDPTRELYHHQSGNMGSWHTINIYLCWSPEQERSEWLSHWASEGVKPLFFVEWGPPHQASWGGHRQGPFIWRNNVNSEPLGIEYGAMLTGDAAYAPDPVMERYVDTYERVYAKGEPFHITSVLGAIWGPDNEKNNIELKTLYTDVVWPRLRTWGITAILPWDYNAVAFRQGSAPPLEQPTDWATLGHPGVTPDFVTNGGYWQSPHDNWTLNSWGESLTRWNQDLLGYLGGAPENFCERGHNVVAGEAIVKQAILVNDTAETVRLPFSWRLAGGRTPLDEGQGELEAAAGGRAMVPFTVRVPAGASGELTLSLRIGSGDTQQVDSLALHVVEPGPAAAAGTVALYDPEGQTRALLERDRVIFAPLAAEAPPATDRGLIIGRQAVRESGPLPAIGELLAAGRRVLVMEQDTAGLTRRLGFRTNDPSLRTVFARMPEHPVLAGLDNGRLHDWRGAGTLLPDQYDLPAAELSDPRFDWLGFANTRVWKWGNTGTVASVVIEKPQRGDFTALLDGGFDLQYSPLLLQRVGGGEILYCQLDLSGREGRDPAADRLWANLVAWVSQPADPPAARPVRYVGDPAVGDQLRRLGIALAPAGPPTAGDLIVVGPGAGEPVAGLAAAVEAGANCLFLHAAPEALQGVLPFEVTTAQEARTVSPMPAGPVFTGLGPSDLHWRGRREVTLVAGPGQAPNVVNAVAAGRGQYVFCQVLPDDWDYADPYRIYLKPTARRTASLLSRLLANLGGAGEVPTVALWDDTSPARVELTGEWQAAKDDRTDRPLDELGGLAGWRPLQVPGTFESQVPAWADHDGVVWYRRTFEWTGPVPDEVALRVGKVDDEDWTWLNGTFLGHIGKDTHPDDHWQHPRVYPVPAGVLRQGTNELVVKVLDTFQSGGIVSGPVDVGGRDRWLRSYYLDTPAQLDDPYRYNRW